MKTPASVILVLFLTFLLAQSCELRAGTVRPTVSLCELVRNPDKYNGKQVVVRATYKYWFETSQLYCLDCQDQGKVWLEMPIELEDTSARALKKMPKAGIVNMTVQGFFFAGGSFGHQNGYRFKIEPTKLSDVVIIQKGIKPLEEETKSEKRWACGGENPRGKR